MVERYDLALLTAGMLAEAVSLAFVHFGRGPAAIPFFLMGLAWLVASGCWRIPTRRLLPGLCRICGYDLRATPSRCPECGTTTASA